MSDIILKHITYSQLRKGDWQTDDDRYGLAAFVDEKVRNTFLECPNTDDDTKTALQIAVNNGVIVGRRLLYSTRIKAGETIVKAQATGSAEVQESYRGKGIGSKMRNYTLYNDEYPFWLFSLLSTQCLTIMRKPENGCVIFDFPELIKIMNIEPAFACRGLKGIPLKICKGLGNTFLGLINMPTKARISRLKKKYQLRKEDDIPEWAGDMCMNDGHKYAELHDNAWLRWNLNHNLTGKPQDKQSFYSIYKENIPVGFFFTKERLRDDVSSEMIIGTLCEWASVDNELTETDINLLALSTLDKKCYYMRTVTNDPRTCNEMKGMWFRNHGKMQMGFKDKLGQYPDMADQSKWRIRFGCCNSILY